MSQLEANYGLDRITHIEWHVIQQFNCPGANARELVYTNVPATPDVFFAGQNHVVGGGIDMYPIYEPRFLQAEAAGSRLLLDSHLFLDAGTGTGTATVHIEVAPGETIVPADHNVYVLLNEDVTLVGNVWKHIGRQQLGPMAMTVANGGESETVVFPFTLDAQTIAIVPENLEAIAVVQHKTTDKIEQADLSAYTYDVETVNLGDLAQSVTGGATTEYDTEVTYLGAVNDDVVASIDTSALPGGWTAEVEWNGSTSGTSVTIPAMTNGQTETVTVRVFPTVGPNFGSVELNVEPDSDPLRQKTSLMHTFNDTPSILFVDDSRGEANGGMFEQAITGASYFSVTYDFAAEGRPDASLLNSFDVIVWTTGSLQSGTIGGGIQDDLASFMDGGGRLFFVSQGYLNQQGINPFTTDYLQVSAYQQDEQAFSAVGVASDPIGDGLNLNPLSPPFTDLADVVTPNTNGVPWLVAPGGNIAARHDAGNYRCVFMSAAWEGISEVAADPNNQASVMERILDWLTADVGLDVVTPIGSATSLDLRQNAPNPFRDNTSVRFAVPKDARATIDVYNVAGQKVANLVDAVLPQGEHEVAWDGRDASGRRVASGVYLYRLDVDGKALTKEMVLLK